MGKESISIVLTLWLLCLRNVYSFIQVINTDARYPDRTADFGPRVPPDSITGFLVPVEYLDDGNQWGCRPIDRKKTSPNSPLWNELLREQNMLPKILFAHNNTATSNQPMPWIALVERGKCAFIDKVRAMQSSGATAVIVGDNQKGPLIKMFATGNTSDVFIPSAFVMQWEYRDLKFQALERRYTQWQAKLRNRKAQLEGPGNHHPANKDYNNSEPTIPSLGIRIFPDEFIDWPLFEVMAFTLLIPGLIVMAFFVLWRLRLGEVDMLTPPGLNISDTPAPIQMVNNLPQKVYDPDICAPNDPDICAICLEDFAYGDNLRRLPCKHEFHCDCIDPWLLTRKRTCPICKADCCPNASLLVQSTDRSNRNSRDGFFARVFRLGQEEEVPFLSDSTSGDESIDILPDSLASLAFGPVLTARRNAPLPTIPLPSSPLPNSSLPNSPLSTSFLVNNSPLTNSLLEVNSPLANNPPLANSPSPVASPTAAQPIPNQQHTIYNSTTNNTASPRQQARTLSTSSLARLGINPTTLSDDDYTRCRELALLNRQNTPANR